MTSSFTVPPGLCARCCWLRVVSGRGASFVLCRLSEKDARFPRYPALPVVRCDGFAEGDGGDGGDGGAEA